MRLRELSLVVAASNAPPKVKSLRTNELRSPREMRSAALFCYGLVKLIGRHVSVAGVEAQDFDAVGRWDFEGTVLYSPIQLKEVVPAHLNPKASLEVEVSKLVKYVDSTDLTVVIYVNRLTQFDMREFKVPSGLRIAALWVIAALDPHQSEWGLWGDFLCEPQAGRFLYPTME